MGGGAVLVGDGVVGHHIGGFALGQVLVGGIGGIEAVAAVGVEREPGDGASRLKLRTAPLSTSLSLAATVPVMVVSSVPALVSATATGASLVRGQ